MQLKPEEISKVIRSQIKYYENAIRQDETGTVLMVGDGIARVSGLANCMAGELLEFEDGSFGMAQNLEENSVSVVLFGSGETISEEQMVKRTGKVVSVSSHIYNSSSYSSTSSVTTLDRIPFVTA
jgi:F-type H+/Na+-transporting ATPase subunit alpha